MQSETKQMILNGNYPLVGEGPGCPKCRSTRTYYSCLAQNHLCTNCGTEFDGTSKMQPVGTLKKIKTSEMGIYYGLNTGKVIFISHSDMAFSLQMKAFRSKFEEDWPLLWMLRKMDIPTGPVEFKNTSRTREGMLMEDPADLYFLTKADLLRCGIGDIVSDRILLAIENSKTRPLGKVIFSLGILGIGREWGEKLARKFGSIDALGRATWEELVLTPGLGATLVRNILEFFHTEGSWKMVEKLRIAGVHLSATEVPARTSTISGKTFMFTGRLETMTRAQAQATVVEAGGSIGSGVSKNTDYLVVGGKPGSKLGKAIALAVARITEQEFYTLLQKEVPNE